MTIGVVRTKAGEHREALARGAAMSADADEAVIRRRVKDQLLRCQRKERPLLTVVGERMVALECCAHALEGEGVGVATAHRAEAAHGVSADEPGGGAAGRHADGQRDLGARGIPHGVAQRASEGGSLDRRDAGGGTAVERHEEVVALKVVQHAAGIGNAALDRGHHLPMHADHTLGSAREVTNVDHHDGDCSPGHQTGGDPGNHSAPSRSCCQRSRSR
mmetsp:Transcript_46108/g.142013  ORF Transcript_46108/g.142013 Transcript_46108/m.142013 type:complete len:218 (-) Transcript_46108:1336-1989(-)